jgi:hypothetical protein
MACSVPRHVAVVRPRRCLRRGKSVEIRICEMVKEFVKIYCLSLFRSIALAQSHPPQLAHRSTLRSFFSPYYHTSPLLTSSPRAYPVHRPYLNRVLIWKGERYECYEKTRKENRKYKEAAARTDNLEDWNLTFFIFNPNRNVYEKRMDMSRVRRVHTLPVHSHDS